MISPKGDRWTYEEKKKKGLDSRALFAIFSYSDQSFTTFIIFDFLLDHFTQNKSRVESSIDSKVSLHRYAELTIVLSIHVKQYQL